MKRIGRWLVLILISGFPHIALGNVESDSQQSPKSETASKPPEADKEFPLLKDIHEKSELDRQFAFTNLKAQELVFIYQQMAEELVEVLESSDEPRRLRFLKNMKVARTGFYSWAGVKMGEAMQENTISNTRFLGSMLAVFAAAIVEWGLIPELLKTYPALTPYLGFLPDHSIGSWIRTVLFGASAYGATFLSLRALCLNRARTVQLQAPRLAFIQVMKDSGYDFFPPLHTVESMALFLADPLEETKFLQDWPWLRRDYQVEISKQIDTLREKLKRDPSVSPRVIKDLLHLSRMVREKSFNAADSMKRIEDQLGRINSASQFEIKTGISPSSVVRPDLNQILRSVKSPTHCKAVVRALFSFSNEPVRKLTIY